LYFVRFRMRGGAPLACAIVSPKKRWANKSKIEIATPHETFREIITALWKACEEVSQDNTLPPAERENWKPGRRLGARIDTITRRLTKEVRQIRARKRV